eukprot:6655690-Prymnesium_polylepis.1
MHERIARSATQFKSCTCGDDVDFEMSDESRNSWNSCEMNSPALSEWNCPMRLVGHLCPVRLLKSAKNLRMRAGASLLRAS